MSNPTPISIIIDDRIRLISAALAATTFPQSAQDIKRHHAHAHARATIKYMLDRQMDKHPAILALQGMLDQGTPLEAFFTEAMKWEWPGLKAESLSDWVPPGWNTQLWDFYEKAEIAKLWEGASSAWDGAKVQSSHIFDNVYFKDTLESFIGEIGDDFAFMPNILYPADRELCIRVGKQIIAIVPPPLAWGESPPWPFDEDSMLSIHVFPSTISAFARLLMLEYLRANAEKVGIATQTELPVSDQMQAQYPTWEEQFVALFKSACVAIYLEEYLNPTESRGYMVMEKRVHNLTILPGTVSVLRRYLQEKGNRYESLADFLTVFPKQLRVAKKIVTL